MMSEFCSKYGPRLTIDSKGDQWAGLMIAYAEPPRGWNFSDLMTFLFGCCLTGVGAYVLWGCALLIWENTRESGGYGLLTTGAFFFLSGIAVAVHMLKYRTRLQNGLLIQYQVHIEDGKAVFLHNSDSVFLNLSKISRIWIERDATNTITTDVDIMACCNGILERKFDIIEISRLIGKENDNRLVTGIVDYLNSHIEKGQREIQAGYIPEYVAEYRNQK